MDRKDNALRQFGQRLTALRKQKGLSIRDLADATGLGHHQIEDIEEGRVNLLFTTILALARGLEVTPAQLLDFP
jgi:transcriptional regulator with XRE-family HTH domain